jgi:hypothetical protein
MQDASWIALFRRIPVNLHDGIALTLSTGAEVVIQQIVKLDSDCVVVRGRLAGTQDNGRVVVLPFSTLASFNFTRHMSEAEVDAIFGSNAPTIAAVPTGMTTPSAETAASGEPAAVGNGQADLTRAPTRPAMPSKSILIAKLRARLNETNKVAP